jgi:chromosome segregation ATPase
MSIFPNPSPQGPIPPAPPPQGAPPYNPPPQYAAPPPQYVLAEPPSSGGGWKIAVLFVAVIALIGACVYLYMQLDKTKQDLVKTNDMLQNRIDKLEEASSVTTRSNRKTVDELREQLERARRQASALVGEAKQEALKKVEDTRAQLETAQEQNKQQLKSDISQVREQTDTANTKISQVGNDVTAVKTDLTSTKSELEKTVAELKRATGDIDGHSVMIATNGKELAALRALGERNFVEFTVHKSKQAQKVGDVSILLKNADPKRNRYTIELTADDKTTEKKDRTANEPVQFMTSKAKQPYELIVNDVKKDTIAGYLSVPKVQNVRN